MYTTSIVNSFSEISQTEVIIAPWVMHRSPKFWQDPLKFYPERWEHQPPNAWYYLPFSGGPRYCSLWIRDCANTHKGHVWGRYLPCWKQSWFLQWFYLDGSYNSRKWIKCKQKLQSHYEQSTECIVNCVLCRTTFDKITITCCTETYQLCQFYKRLSYLVQKGKSCGERIEPSIEVKDTLDWIAFNAIFML